MFETYILALSSISLSPSQSGSWVLLFVYFSLAIGVSFFCSVWESVLLSLTDPYIENFKNKKANIGKKMEFLKNGIHRPLISILTLNTIAHTLGAMGVASQVSALGGGKFDLIASIVMTLIILIASEIIPKNLGARYWREWAPWVTVCLSILIKLMAFFVKTIELFSSEYKTEASFNKDELRVMADLGSKQGKLKEEESRILTNLLQFGEISVQEVMTPRVVVFSLSKDTTVREFLNLHKNSPFSRIPIYGNKSDDIKGFVLKHDILLAGARDEFNLSLNDLVREILQLPQNIKLSEAFQTILENRHHIAITLDEYGGVSGLVTMEDIVETLLGLEIVDEADRRENMQDFARKLWEARAARMSIDINYTKSDQEKKNESLKEKNNDKEKDINTN